MTTLLMLPGLGLPLAPTAGVKGAFVPPPTAPYLPPQNVAVTTLDRTEGGIDFYNMTIPGGFFGSNDFQFGVPAGTPAGKVALAAGYILSWSKFYSTVVAPFLMSGDYASGVAACSWFSVNIQPLYGV